MAYGRHWRRYGVAVIGAIFLFWVFVTVFPQTAEAQSFAITQITDTTGGGDSRHPSINADGTRIAFSSNRNHTGGNPDGNGEIFLYDTTTSTITQVTNTSTGDSWVPSINADGTRIAFYSTSDPTGGNPDGNDEIFLYNTTTSTLTQITNTTGGANSSPSINADGTRIAFRSNRNLTGGNADGNPEIFLYNTNTSTLTQITNTTGGDNWRPSINADGTRIAFQSDRNHTGGNPDGNYEIFLYDTTTSTFTQVTNTTGGDNYTPSINADGTRIAFRSTSDLTGGNPDGNGEIFLYNTTTSTSTQVTDTTGGSTYSASINADGTRIAFSSNLDLTGENADGNDEIFLATLCDLISGDVCYSYCPVGSCPPSYCIVNVPGMAGCMGIGQLTYCGCAPGACALSQCIIYIPFP